MNRVLERLSNPHLHRCTCAQSCWCQRTSARRLFRWCFPFFHTIPAGERGWELQ